LRGAELRLTDLELGVTKPVAKRIERRPRHVEVLRSVTVLSLRRTARVHVIVVDRNLAHCARYSHRQLATRIYLTKEDIGDRIACLTATHPRFENRRHVVSNPADRQWSPIFEHHDRRLAGSLNRLHEFHLTPRQIECGK